MSFWRHLTSKSGPITMLSCQQWFWIKSKARSLLMLSVTVVAGRFGSSTSGTMETGPSLRMISNPIRCCDGKSGLNGKTLRVSAVSTLPYLMVGEDRPMGYDVEVMDILAKKLNFTFAFKKEREWEELTVNGTTAGAVNSVRFFTDFNVSCWSLGSLNFMHQHTKHAPFTIGYCWRLAFLQTFT